MTTEPPVRVVRITWTSAVLAVSVVVGLFLLRAAFVGAHRVLGWTAASIAVAVLADPVAMWLSRWIPRVLAVLLTFAVVAGAIGGLVFVTFDDLDGEVDRLQEVTPGAIEDLETRDDELGRIASEIDLSTRAEVFLQEVDARVGSGSGALAENAPTVPVYLVSAILSIFLLFYGPRIARGAGDQISDPDRRATLMAVVARATVRARRTVTALLVQGVVVGVASFGVARALDIPAPIVLGLIAGVVAMLPDVGVLMGTFPIVALTAGLESIPLAGVILAVALAVQLFEAFYVRRRIRDFGVDVGPAVVWIVALLGYTIYGPGMAIFGVAYAIFALSVIDQVPEARAGR